MTDPKAGQPACPRCAYGEPDEFCQVCALLHSGIFPAVVVLTFVVGSPPARGGFRRFLIVAGPVFLGGWVVATLVSDALVAVGIDPLMRLAISLCSAVTGMFAAALVIDHAPRWLSRRRPPVATLLPPATLPQQGRRSDG